ncbi:MAG: ABC transporter substrate-binding protein [Alphaproteobacteria bacterium]|nr:ABC transporter substrate-binding protein [Alphaproteobacteria bacterium]
MHAIAAFIAALFLAAPAFADIAIGIVGPMTGPDAPTGEQVRRGAEAAVDDINAKGGVLGQKLRLSVKDDVDDPRQAVASANQLASEGVIAVVGHVASGASIPASKVYDEEGMVMVSPASTNPELTEQGFDAVFRLCGRDDRQGAVAAAFILEKFPGANIAIIHDKTAYGQGLADIVRAELAKAGVKKVLFDTITRGERDFSALTSKMKEAKIDVIYYGGYHSEGGLMVRQMRDQKFNAVFIGADDLTTLTFWTITGSSGQGSYVSFMADPRKNPAAAEAVDKIRATGYEPESYTLFSYAAVQLLADAMTRAGKADPAAMAKIMHEQSFDTVLGSIDFDKKGDVGTQGFVMYQWRDGNYHQLD